MTDFITAANAFAQNLAVPGSPTARPAALTDVSPGHVSYSAAFVGAQSVDFIFTAIDIAALSGTDGAGSLEVLLDAAFAAAAATAGAATLSPVEKIENVTLDEDADVFEVTAAGRTIGFLSARARQGAGNFAATDENVAANINRISDVEMALTVEIGRTRVAVRDVLGLEPGAVVELDRSAGAPADILLNGRLIAHGEIVVVDQDYAVRITKILEGKTA